MTRETRILKFKTPTSKLKVGRNTYIILIQNVGKCKKMKLTLNRLRITFKKNQIFQKFKRKQI